MSTSPTPESGAFDRRLDFAPWSLSGTVLGPLLNDPAALAALGQEVHAAPYKAPPRAPVLYIQPRNTLAASGATVPVSGDVPAFEIGATLGLVVGRTACRVAASQALAFVAGWVLVADLSVPQTSFYRPSLRFKVRDRSCLIGRAVAAQPRSAFDPETAVLRVQIEGRPLHEVSMAGMQRPAARLLEEVSEFMTLHPGDVLLLGLRHGAPRVVAGERFSVLCEGLGALEGRLSAGQQVPEVREMQEGQP